MDVQPARGLRDYPAIVKGALLALVAALVLALQTGAPRADDLAALARLDPEKSLIEDKGQGAAITLALSQPVPYRVSFLDGPPRMIVDFKEVDFAGVRPDQIGGSDRITSIAWGRFAPGWSRMVAELSIPLGLASAEERSGEDGSAAIMLRLLPTTPAAFAEAVASAGPPAPGGDWVLPAPAADPAPLRRQTGDRPLRVMLDPGHGGIDPGAEAGGTTEAKLMLLFTQELAEVLRRGGMEVSLTRQEDVFVPLETRVSMARAAGADVFLSLHADALAEGEATGATIYRLDEKASDTAAELLAERHDRSDLIAGIDLSQSDDEVAQVLMDLARIETRPRADRLAAILTDVIKASDIKMHRRPIQSAAFSVLKAADIPSLLIEVGFLSSQKDLERLSDPKWRAGLQQAILTALSAWAIADAAEAKLIRQ